MADNFNAKMEVEIVPKLAKNSDKIIEKDLNDAVKNIDITIPINEGNLKLSKAQKRATDTLSKISTKGFSAYKDPNKQINTVLNNFLKEARGANVYGNHKGVTRNPIAQEIVRQLKSAKRYVKQDWSSSLSNNDIKQLAKEVDIRYSSKNSKNKFSGLKNITPKFNTSKADLSKTNDHEIYANEFSEYRNKNASSEARDLAKINRQLAKKLKTYKVDTEHLDEALDKIHEQDPKLKGSTRKPIVVDGKAMLATTNTWEESWGTKGRQTTDLEQAKSFMDASIRELQDIIFRIEAGDNDVFSDDSARKALINAIKLSEEYHATRGVGKPSQTVTDTIVQTLDDALQAIYTQSMRKRVGGTKGEEQGVGVGHEDAVAWQKDIQVMFSKMSEEARKAFEPVKEVGETLKRATRTGKAGSQYEQKKEQLNSGVEQELKKAAIQDRLNNSREAIADEQQLDIAKEDASSGFNTDDASKELIEEVSSLNKADGFAANIQDSIKTGFEDTTSSLWISILKNIDNNLSKIAGRIDKQPKTGTSKISGKGSGTGGINALSTWLWSDEKGWWQDTPHNAAPGMAIGPKLNYFRDKTDYSKLNQDIDPIIKHVLEQEMKAVLEDLRKAFSTSFRDSSKSIQKSIQESMFKNQTGGLLKNIFGFSTFGLGYALMPSLEKSRGQADASNTISKDLIDAFSAAELANDADAMERLSDDAEKFAIAMEKSDGNIEKVSRSFRFVSPELRKDNQILENINAGLTKSGEVLKHQTRFSEILNYTFQLMSRYIGQMVKSWLLMINPINLIRRAFSDFTSYNVKWQRTMNVLKYNLRAIIRPAMEKIAQIIVNIIGLLNSLTNGINRIFGKQTANWFDQASANSEKIHEELEAAADVSAGFDELHDIGSDNSGANDLMGGDIYTPQWKSLQEVFENIGGTLGWIGKTLSNIFGENSFGEILGALAGILTFLTLIKLGLGGLKALGIGLMISGIVTAIQSLLDYLNDPSWENFGKIIKGIGLAIAGLGILLGNIPLILAGIGVLIVGIIIKNWDKIKEFLGKGIKWLEEKGQWIHEHLGEVIGGIYDGFINAIKIVLGWFDTLFTSIKGVFDGIITFIKGVFTGNWTQAWEGIKQIFANVWNAIWGTFTTFINLIINAVTTFVKTIWNLITAPFKAIQQLAGNFSTGNGEGYGGGGSGGRSRFPSYAIGTDYVPNDGLAYLHQGEAVIPKKYNQLNNNGLTNEERSYMQQMMATMQSLDGTMRQGIKVSGQFTQRGSDLVAVVNRTKSQTGADLISNVAYAR